MSQFAINLIWDQSVLSQPNAAQIEATLTSAAQVFASNFSNPITLNLHVGWGEVGGQAFEADAIGESLPNLVNYSYAQVSAAVPSLPRNSPTGTVAITDVQAAALGLSGSTAVDASIGFSDQPGFFAFSSLDIGRANYVLANVFDHEASEVMGRVSNVGEGSLYPTALDMYRYTAPGVTTFNASAAAYFSKDGGVTNEAWFNTNPSGDSGDWSTGVNSDAFGAFLGVHDTGYVSTADQDVMTALGWAPTSAAWDAVFINSETQAWLGRAANAGDVYSYATELANGWTPDQIRQQLLQYSEGRAHTDLQVTGLYDTYMGRDPSASELTTWEGLVFAGDDFTAVRSALLADPSGRAHTDATITSLYETWFGRNPTASETSTWERLIAGGSDFNGLRMALVNDPASHAQTDANIAGEYQTWFGRAPTASETSVWEGLIRSGDDLGALRSALVTDPAGQTHIAQAVTGLYEAYLFRAPTAAEVGVWQGLIVGGASYGDVSAALVQVQQQTEAAIPGLYQTYLGRAPTPAEISYWDGQVTSAGATSGGIRQVLIADAGGQAYLQAGVASLYETWFGRAPTSAEVSVWLGLIAGGDDLTSVRAALIGDPTGQAFIAQTVTSIYQTYLARAPFQSELNAWQAAIAGGEGFSDVTFTAALDAARIAAPAHPDTDIATVCETYVGRAPTAAELAYDPYAYASPLPFRAYLLNTAEAQTYLTHEVTSLFDTYVGRDPTAQELGAWRQLVGAGDDYEIVRATLLLLPEGEAHTTATVTSLYDTYFGRDPTANELTVWQGLIGGGDDFSALRSALINDPVGLAHTNATILSLYDTYMGRDPATAEFNTWHGLIAAGDDFTALRSALLSDPAGHAHTDATVTSLYDSIFARAPSASEIGVWEGLIAGGDTFDQLKDTLLRDPGSAAGGVHQVSLAAGQALTFAPTWVGAAVTGFDPLHNTVHLSSAEFGAINPLDTNHAQQITALDGSTDVLISLDASHTLLLEHTTLASLHQSDFVFT